MKIKVSLGIGFANAKHIDYLEVDEEFYNTLSDDEKEEYLNTMCNDWSDDYIDIGYSIVEETT
jgi:hypothetical protein